MTFYTQDGVSYVRKKGGISADRIANAPEFIRTRENGSEFGGVASVGKVIRDAVRPLVKSSADSRVTGRLVGALTQIKNMDPTSVRGERNVAVGILQPGAKLLLKGFEMNDKAPLSMILAKPYSLNPATGLVTIADLVPDRDFVIPNGATHCVMTSAWSRIDFATGVLDTAYSPDASFALDHTAVQVQLTPEEVQAGAGISVFFLEVVFTIETNGVHYPLQNQSSRSLKIIDVL